MSLKPIMILIAAFTFDIAWEVFITGLFFRHVYIPALHLWLSLRMKAT